MSLTRTETDSTRIITVNTDRIDAAMAKRKLKHIPVRLLVRAISIFHEFLKYSSV